MVPPCPAIGKMPGGDSSWVVKARAFQKRETASAKTTRRVRKEQTPSIMQAGAGGHQRVINRDKCGKRSAFWRFGGGMPIKTHFVKMFWKSWGR